MNTPMMIAPPDSQTNDSPLAWRRLWATGWPKWSGLGIIAVPAMVSYMRLSLRRRRMRTNSAMVLITKVIRNRINPPRNSVR